MSNLLDFDDSYVPPYHRKTYKELTDDERNRDFQNLGHNKISSDFSDSPFADRKPEEPEHE